MRLGTIGLGNRYYSETWYYYVFVYPKNHLGQFWWYFSYLPWFHIYFPKSLDERSKFIPLSLVIPSFPASKIFFCVIYRVCVNIHTLGNEILFFIGNYSYYETWYLYSLCSLLMIHYAYVNRKSIVKYGLYYKRNKVCSLKRCIIFPRIHSVWFKIKYKMISCLKLHWISKSLHFSDAYFRKNMFLFTTYRTCPKLIGCVLFHHGFKLIRDLDSRKHLRSNLYRGLKILC